MCSRFDFDSDSESNPNSMAPRGNKQSGKGGKGDKGKDVEPGAAAAPQDELVLYTDRCNVCLKTPPHVPPRDFMGIALRWELTFGKRSIPH